MFRTDANIVSLISPFREVREYAREEIGTMVEVYLESTREIRIERDPKGLYKKAISGEISNLTGFDGVYEEPENPAVSHTISMTSSILSIEYMEPITTFFPPAFIPISFRLSISSVIFSRSEILSFTLK